MEIKIEQKESLTIISIIGSLDALTAPQLTADLTQELGAGHNQIVIDLAGMEYTSSAGLRVILNAAKDARNRGGDLRVAAVRPTVNKVFEMSGFTSILKFYPDVDAAVKSFTG
jgi:anti-sigma B factor antagonist